MEPIIYGLITQSIWKSGLIGKDKVESVLRSSEFSEQVDDLATEFNLSFRDSFVEVSKEKGNNELEDIGKEDWFFIADQLNDIDFVFRDEEDAVEEVTSVIFSMFEEEFSHTTKDDLQDIVSESYEMAFRDFREEISNTDLADDFLIEGQIRIGELLTKIHKEFSNLNRSKENNKPYYLFYPNQSHENSEIINRIAQQGAVDFMAPYLDRGIIETPPQNNKYHIKGSPGSGKTRLLIEYTNRILEEESSITQVVIPRADMNSRIDAEPLFQENFSGDVLLVWDDIHDIDSSTQNRVFKHVIESLEQVLNEDHKLWVLATSRADQEHLLPDSDLPESKFWHSFEVTKVPPFSLSEIAQYIELILERENLEIPDSVKSQLYYRIKKIDPTPLYIFSVITEINSLDKNSFLDGILHSPMEKLGTWRNQYQFLRKQEQRQGVISILLSAKILKKSNVPYYESLLRGIYTEIFDQ